VTTELTPGPASAIRSDAVLPYVPRMVLRHLESDPNEPAWTVDGSVVLVDISGFTKLSERLARHGKEGAEQVTEAIEECFTDLLAAAYANGGGLLKFGGDALLLLFEGGDHALRAARSAVWMRRTLRDVGRIDLPGVKIQLRMSVGAHSGAFHFFLVGDSHRELIVAGPAWTRTVAMEHTADAGQILVSPEMADVLPPRCLGAGKGPGVLVTREPLGEAAATEDVPPALDGDAIAFCLSSAVREHVAGGGGAPEHRSVTVAFLRFSGTDTLIAKRGPGAAAEALDELVTQVQASADEQAVCFLASDVDADGGKLILTAGAPINTGSDEERMLFALRRIADAERSIPIQIGVNRGGVFAGDIGPWYRQTYTVMGDAVNLAARLMAKAGPGEIYATAGVLDRSDTRFGAAELEPFAVKGKAQPVQAWSVGKAIGSRSRESSMDRVSLVGRSDEMQVLRDALSAVEAGDGRLVEIVGEPGIGKTRLMEELRDRSEGLLLLHATCEAYTESTPYVAWREILRELLDVGWEDPDDVAIERIYSVVSTLTPELLPWLSLIALPFDVDLPPTLEVEMLGEEFRRPRLHEAVTEFLEAVLAEPALIEIEDAHHMDDASSELLRYLADHLEGNPWLFCVTRRAEGRGFTGPTSPTTAVVEAGPLAPDDALSLAEAAAEHDPLPPHVLSTVAERSGGNPQFLRDLLRAAAATGGAQGLPDSVEAAAMATIDRLVPADRMLVRRASVLGQAFHPRMLAWVFDEGVPIPDDGTWERLDAFFEHEGDGFVRFRRALLRDAAYEGLPYRLRRSLHGAVADQLEAASAGADDEVEALSLHCFLAGRYEGAWRYSRAAGDVAREKFAPSDASRFYRRALDAASRAEPGTATAHDIAAVTESFAEMLLRAGELDAALKDFAQARRMLADDSIATARILLREAYVAERVGRPDLVVRRARRAAAQLASTEAAAAAELRAQAAISEAAARQIQGRTDDAIQLSLDAMDQAQQIGDRKAWADAAVVLDWALFEMGRIEEATHMHDALEVYESIGDFHSVASAYNTLGALDYFQGRWVEAIEQYERLVETKERLGDPVHAANGTMNVAEVLSDQGRWEEADERLRRVLRVARGANEENFVAFATAYLGRVASRSGRGDEGEALLSDALASFTAQRAGREVQQVSSWLAEHHLLVGRWADALAAADALADADGASGALLQRVRGVALARLGDEGAARSALHESLRLGDEEASSFERLSTFRAVLDLWPDAEDADSNRRSAEALEEDLGVIRLAKPPP
jgi:class 3 adenylate cyclase/tetratricopeptide (TPR) repeat protein